MARIWRLLFALILIGGAYGLRAPWLSRDIWNLDEGSTFTMGEQVLHGDVIYRDAADNRSPLVPYLKAAIFAVAGDWNARAVHGAVALLLGLGAVLLWLTARRLGDEVAGIAAAIFFSVLTLLMLGLPDTLSAHTGWFVVCFSIAGYGLFAGAQDRPGFGRGLVIGACFGLGTLCKQPGMLDLGVTFVLIGLLAWTVPERRRGLLRLAAGEFAGFAILMAAAVAYFAAEHAFRDFVFYAWTYNTKYYVPEVPVWERLWAIRTPFLLLKENMPAGLLAGIAGAVLLLRRAWSGLRQRPAATPVLPWLILGWTAAGIVSTVISGRSFSHYSAQVIPGLSLACGWTVARVLEYARARRGVRPALRAALLALLVIAVVDTGVELRRRLSRFSLDDGPLKTIGHLAAQYTSPPERLFVWGYLPEMYFFSQRLPSTRFIYTNYLTGMIPWTNLDWMVDTRYAVVPGSWEHLWEDLDRHPPALIVETGGIRGYLKYPLERQERLWGMVASDFALVDFHATQAVGLRFYRRLAPLPAAAPPPGSPDDASLSLTTSLTPHGGRLPMLGVTAPAGIREILVIQGDKPYRRLEYPEDRPCEAAFFVDRRDLATGPTGFRIAVRRADGWHLSRPTDLAAFRTLPAPIALEGPTIRLGDRDLLPIAGETSSGGTGSGEDKGGFRWQAHAPSRFVWECPRDLTKLSFGFGLDESSYASPDASTSGVDAVVSFEQPDGGLTQLFWRRLNPRIEDNDRGPQHAKLDLPPHTGGRLILEFQPGPMSDPSFDWSYWLDLGGTGVGPDLRYGERRIPASIGEQYDGHPMAPDPYNRWSAQSPARLVYPFVAGMSSLVFTYGLDERSYDPVQGPGTDGVEISVEFEHANLRVERLFDRLLDPRAIVDDRGPQTTRVNLPRGAKAGRIIVRVGPGPRQNQAFDWAYLAQPRAQGPGPDITWGGRILVPVEGENFNGPGLEQNDADIWGAHAPSRLVYDRPPGLEAVSFSYGLDPGSYANPDPGKRTDGVDVSVQFQEPDGRSTTLFHRRLTPASNPDDRGRQSARVQLPAGRPGRLVFVVGPGPYGSNAFDWAYWTGFYGAP